MPIALVTGAGIRLGRATALALAEAGHDLLLHVHRSRTGAEEVARLVAASGRRATIIHADLSTPEGQQALAQDVAAVTAQLDVVVHNAGIFEKLAFEKVSREAWRTMLALNLEAPYFLTQALLPALKAAPSACVVHVTDIAGDRPVAGYSHYSVSKAGLSMLTRALSAELAPQGIRVNAVAPGSVMFPEDFDDETRARFLARIPMRREGTPEDVAKAVVFLVRDAPYVTGQVLAVDGGRSGVL